VSLPFIDQGVRGSGRGAGLGNENTAHNKKILFFFFTLVTGPRRSLSLKLSDTRVYAPQIRGDRGTKNPEPIP
jgi:hypothetical protein